MQGNMAYSPSSTSPLYPLVGAINSSNTMAPTSSTPAADNRLEWPEPIVRVQKLAESGIIALPPRYVRPPEERPAKVCNDNNNSHNGCPQGEGEQAPPVVDLSSVLECGTDLDLGRRTTMRHLSSACMEWGVFQVVNHGIPHELLMSTMAAARGFFELPVEEKIQYANDPISYEGYGSRMGVQKGIILDWGDYFFHHVYPLASRNDKKWPTQPPEYRRIVELYCERVLELYKTLLSLFSENLDLPKGALVDKFGGEEGLGLCFRMNYYPRCPQPELALGLSAHTDPGCVSIILQDQVCGLQVKKNGTWISVPPIKDALVVLIADQLEILSNGVYKSVDHRTIVNNKTERMSLVAFCNPDGEKRIGPMESIVERSGFRLYQERTFNEYRMFIRTLGGKGKSFLDLIKQRDDDNR